ncbi:hypothetical protein, partial [Streptococcus pneumoniae]|uniref:hypothetical protein n=1 Tax=Streptococcus pneumoniae TaxID=1313 RepID=UPI001C5A952E
MKKLHRAFNVFSCFQTRKKGATEPNSLSHFKACEKRPVGVLIRFLVFKLMKKGSIIFVVGKSLIDIMEPIFV